MQGNMNKIVALQQALRDTPPDAAGWLWWLDVDTLIVDVAAPLPLQRWAGKDVVLWGQRELVEAGNIQGGLASLPGAPKLFPPLRPAGEFILYYQPHCWRKLGTVQSDTRCAMAGCNVCNCSSTEIHSCSQHCHACLVVFSQEFGAKGWSDSSLLCLAAVLTMIDRAIKWAMRFHQHFHHLPPLKRQVPCVSW